MHRKRPSLRSFRRLAAVLRDDSAQGLVEYAIVVALVALLAIATLRALGRRVNNSLSSASNGFS